MLTGDPDVSDFKKLTTIFVTGSTGFIGRHPAKRLAQEGLLWAPMKRKSTNCTWITQRIPPNSTCVHLAGLSDLSSTSINPENVLREARSLALGLVDMNFANIILASSAAVYGDKQSKPHVESDPVVLDHPYARVKWETENILLKGRGGTVVRFANVYGLGMAKNNIFSDILNQLSPVTDSITIRDGSCIRDFVHVQDIIDALILLLQAPKLGIFNLGSGVGTKTGELARMVLDLVGQTTRRVACSNASDLSSRVVLDGSLMMKTYGWRPRRSLQDGISEILTFYKSRST